MNTGNMSNDEEKIFKEIFVAGIMIGK